MNENKTFNEVQQRSLAKNLLTGSISGSTVFVSPLPLDYIKQWTQSGHTIQDIKNNIKNNGYRVLWRGGLVGSSLIAPQIATKLGALSLWNKVIPKCEHHEKKRKLGLGFLAGYVDGFIFGPILAIQAYQQVNAKASIKESFSAIKQSSLLKYTQPLALRNAFYTMPVFGALYPLKEKLFKESSVTPIESPFLYTSQIFTSAFLLNIPGTILCSPYDVIRAKQIQLLHEYKQNEFSHVIKQIWKKQGIRGFYAGYTSLLINFAMRFPLTVMFNEYLGVKL